MQAKTITEILAAYICEFEKRTLPKEEILSSASSFFSDGFACLVGGMQSPPSKIAADWVREEESTRKDAWVFGHHFKTGAVNAALVNGISAHYLDYDDVSYSSNAHVSAVLVPTVLSLGQMYHASGREVLTAYIVGVEVIGLLGRLMGDEAFRKGWHTTSLLGVFGAAAAAGKLMGLTRKQMEMALSLAASEASGSKGNFGTMAKAFHAGSAASKGIRCARLCAMGFDANPMIFETHGGFQDLIVSRTDRDKMIEAIVENRSEFADPGLVMKPYPTCKAGHNGINAALELAQEYQLTPEDIRHIEVRVQAYAPDTLRFRIPKNGLEGRFSMNYGVALAIRNGRICLSDFTDREITDPRLIDLMERIDMVVDESLSGGKLLSARGDTVITVETADGRTLTRREDYAVGDPMKPMSKEERAAKLRDCLASSLDAQRVDQVLDHLSRLEKLEDISVLCDLIA